ncbi:hypothetical protein SAMN05216264_10564 [Pseudomonas marincola]|nr:hypothetical protein SAMN05216264_10564 [Pseudomonas marincola]
MQLMIHLTSEDVRAGRIRKFIPISSEQDCAE